MRSRRPVEKIRRHAPFEKDESLLVELLLHGHHGIVLLRKNRRLIFSDQPISRRLILLTGVPGTSSARSMALPIA